MTKPLKRFLTAGATLLLGLLLTAAVASPSDNQATQSPTWDSSRRFATGEIGINNLPLEAKHTLDLIKSGGPFPYSRDGVTFGNRERILPSQKRGYYHEYTVPTPGAKNRGARRIIAGKLSEYYYTDDHYRSFRRVKE
ncbi:MAG: ribonuclease domain-containing protein [Pseudomonadota bacterium]